MYTGASNLTKNPRHRFFWADVFTAYSRNHSKNKSRDIEMSIITLGNTIEKLAVYLSEG